MLEAILGTALKSGIAVAAIRGMEPKSWRVAGLMRSAIRSAVRAARDMIVIIGLAPDTSGRRYRRLSRCLSRRTTRRSRRLRWWPDPCLGDNCNWCALIIG